MKSIAVIAASVLVLAVAVSALATADSVSDCGNTSNNTIPVCDTPPILLKKVPNGKLYLAGCGNDTFRIVHVWGTPYQQGFAQGQLQPNAIRALPGMITTYIEEMIAGNVPSWIPQWVIDIVAEYGAPYLFELTYNWTKPFTPQRYIDEMQGIADGAGVDVKQVIAYNMFPETTKAACTIVGATGPSTANKQIAHLRALDFPVDCPIKDYAQITVYHSGANSTEPNVANFGWAGMVGSLTGLSDTAIGVGEKVWINHPKGIEGVHGQPWMFILRDVLIQPNMDAALATIQNANRTCAIHVGVGDSTTNTFRGLTIAKDSYTVYNDTSLNYPEHPILPGIMYWDKHVQPTSSYCLPTLLRQYYGSIDAETLALKVSAAGATGSFHSITLDYANLVAFVANSRKTTVTSGDINAYNRQFTRVDVKKLFAEQL